MMRRSLSLWLLAGCAAPGPAPAPVTVPTPRAAPAVALKVAASVVDASCESGQAFLAADKAYCVLDEPLSWHEAARRCQSLGGDLAEFETRSEQLAVDKIWRSPLTVPSLWLGLTRGRGEWQWSGQPLSYDGWAVGEPNNSGGQERCGEWLRSDGRFNDLPCEERRGVLCEAGPESGHCAGQPLTTDAGEYCVHEGTQLPWAQAQALCAENGFRLAELESEQEAALLADALASRLRATRLWLGLSDEAEEGHWRWASDAPVEADIAGWGQGQPDNYNAEHCGEWRLDSGDWNDIRCDAPHSALCEFAPTLQQAAISQNETTANSEAGGRVLRAGSTTP